MNDSFFASIKIRTRSFCVFVNEQRKSTALEYRRHRGIRGSIFAAILFLSLWCAPFAFAQSLASSNNEGVIYMPFPQDGLKEGGTMPLQNSLQQIAGDSIEENEDRIVIFTDKDGNPILPDLEAAKNQKSGAGSLSAMAFATVNELTFTFNSPLYPWSPADLTALSAALTDFYPAAKALYGDPAFNITVNIRKDPALAYIGLYYPSTNEIVLRNASLDVLCHELIHAFRDDNLIELSSYEEGMARTAEVEIFNRLDKYTHWNEHHSYEYDVYYDGLNKQIIGPKNGSFFVTNPTSTFQLLRYQLTGYAWAKVLFENPNFFIDFNREFYARALSDGSVRLTESKLLDIAVTVQSAVEGKPFLTWYDQQGVLNANPAGGYFLYQRINPSLVYFFYRAASGSEIMQPNVTIQWNIYDHQDLFIGSGSGVTSSYGWTTIPPPVLPNGYTGRIRVEATASVPGGTISDTSLKFVGNAEGIFGIVPKSDSGIITITPLEDPSLAVSVNVVNGAFSASSLAAVKGRFLAEFIGTNGYTFSKQFNKDASRYFLFMENNTYTVTPSAGAGGTISPNTPQIVDYGSFPSFTVNSNTGYTAVIGSCGGTLVGTTYTTNAITSDCTVTASFTLNTLNVSIDGAGRVTSTPTGIDCVTDCFSDYTRGISVTLTASPANGWDFTGWSGDCDTSGQVIMDADKTCIATFNLLPDTDLDGISDNMDNCTLVVNPDQRDTDGDLYGNMCDGDLNNIGTVVNNTDRALFIQAFGKSSALYPDADFDGAGAVINNADRAIFLKLFGKAPGPSGLK